MSDDRLPAPIDAMRVRALFAPMQDEAFVVREVAQRLAERLDIMKIAPRVVVDAGAGLGYDRSLLASRYPEALAVGLDAARRPPSVTPPRRLARFFRGKAPPSCWLQADFGQLPLASGSVDLLWSNCALHWSATPSDTIDEWSRVLRPGGLLLFSCFGPDTLREVRSAFAKVDAAAHTFAFVDMHDYGDMMTRAALLDPVVDMETITLTFTDAGGFWRDVRAFGGNALLERRRGLLGRAGAARLAASLAALRNDAGRLPLSVEVIYGHAWKGVPRHLGDGSAVIALPKSRRASA